MFRRILRNIQGNISTVVAVAAIPIIGSIGAGVDYSRAYEQKTIAEEAATVAARQANRLGTLLPADGVAEEARRVFAASVDGRLRRPTSVAVDVTDESVTVRTRLTVPTTFLGIIGLDALDFEVTGHSIADDLTYEVALVLDNSGSMAGARMAALKDAASTLAGNLFVANARNPVRDAIKVAVVPFAASVNVGPENALAAWVDGAAKSPRHFENFEVGAGPANGNRFALFDALKVRWAGCLEARPEPYDSSDAAPDTANPATIFVPMFAPDEPDLSGFDNNYIPDASFACLASERRQTNAASAEEAEARLCKYRQIDPLLEMSRNGTVVGPNLNCTSAPLAPLTADRSAVLATIDGLEAKGLTNLHEGIMWGWRALSPGAPFAEGRPYEDDGNRKILVLMTDGANAYDSYRNFNRSMYGAFGYVRKGRLGTTSSDNATVVARMNERTLAACRNVKATGKVRVYTVALGVTDPATLAMLAECASDPEIAFRMKEDSDLAVAFGRIAADVATLRVTN